MLEFWVSTGRDIIGLVQKLVGLSFNYEFRCAVVEQQNHGNNIEYVLQGIPTVPLALH